MYAIVTVLTSESAGDVSHARGADVMDGFQIVQSRFRRLEEAASGENSGTPAEGGESGEGGEGGEGGEAEGEEGEEEVDETSLTVAFLLCGIVAFTVSLFYLVNYNDVNIRRCTWELLSDTVSIFCAVMVYQGVDAFFDEKLEKDEENKVVRFIVGLCHFFFWYIGVQVLSITLCESKTFGRISFKSSCVLGAHLSGFAAKEMYNTVMQAKPFRDEAGLAFVVVLIAIISLFIFTAVSYLVRNTFVYPKMRETQRELCGEEIREIENDMVSLCVGFLISAVLRFIIHGKLPSEELDEKDDHDQWQAWLLYGFSLLFAVGACAVLKVQFVKEFSQHIDRLLDVIKTTLIMVMAWCLLFWGQWEIFDTHFVKRANLARVVLAMLLSVYSIFQVFLLDFIADRMKSKFLRKSCRLVTRGFGLALAFSWEASFDVSIETVAKGTKGFSEAGLKLILALVLCIIVAPAWAWYILPKTMEENEESKGEVEPMAQAGEKGASGATPLPLSEKQEVAKEVEAIDSSFGEVRAPEELRKAGDAESAEKPEGVGKPTSAW